VRFAGIVVGIVNAAPVVILSVAQHLVTREPSRWSSSGCTSNKVPVMSTEARGVSEWTIHGERIIDDTRRAVLSIADVQLPDGVRFEQYVLRVPAAAIVVVLDEADRVLMMWRHRFILNRWVWELPGGYLDPDEDPAACAAREVEEETGWRPRTMEPLLSFQPMVGTIDQNNIIYLARGADHTGATPDINEAERLGWIPLAEVQQRIGDGEIVGAGSVAGLLAVLLVKAAGQL
jgi:8-oxo-dGTP pyrophosphatase MutT (NUDIX family)